MHCGRARGAGDFIVDDDGSGYADVGEEEDWSAEPGGQQDGEEQAPKRQKTADAKKGGSASCLPACRPAAILHVTV